MFWCGDGDRYGRPTKDSNCGGRGGRPRDPPRCLATPPPLPHPIAHLPTLRLQLELYLAASTAPAAPGVEDTADKWHPPAPVTAKLHAQGDNSNTLHRYATGGGDRLTDSAGHVTPEGGRRPPVPTHSVPHPPALPFDSGLYTWHQKLAYKARGGPACDDPVPIPSERSWPPLPLHLGAAWDSRHYAPEIGTAAGDITSGRSCAFTPMKCVTWNIRGLRNPRRRGVVGRYLKEWGANIICLQETMLANMEHCIWLDLGWGEVTQVYIETNGQLGVLLAWKMSVFNQEMVRRGRHIVAACLACRADDHHLVIASAYGPAIPTNRGELCEDLTQLYRAFPNTSLLISEDFNVMLAAKDQPNNMGGLDPGSICFKEVLAHLGLDELGPMDRRFTWRGPTS